MIGGCRSVVSAGPPAANHSLVKLRSEVVNQGMYMYVTFLFWTSFNIQLIGVSEPRGLYAMILDVYNMYIALTL
jgi:hypothetical protein